MTGGCTIPPLVLIGLKGIEQKTGKILSGLKRLSLGDLLDADTKFCRNIFRTWKFGGRFLQSLAITCPLILGNPEH